MHPKEVRRTAQYLMLFIVGVAVFMITATWISFRHDGGTLRAWWAGIALAAAAMIVVLFLVILVAKMREDSITDYDDDSFRCPRCDSEMQFDADYCGNCGLRLTAGGGLHPEDQPPPLPLRKQVDQAADTDGSG